MAGVDVHGPEQAARTRAVRSRVRVVRVGALVGRTARQARQSTRHKGSQPPALLARVRWTRLSLAPQGREAGHSRLAAIAEGRTMVVRDRGHRPEARASVDSSEPTRSARRGPLRGARRVGRRLVGRRRRDVGADRRCDEGGDRDGSLHVACVDVGGGARARRRGASGHAQRRRVVGAGRVAGAARRGSGGRSAGRGEDQEVIEEGAGEWTRDSRERQCETPRWRS